MLRWLRILVAALLMSGPSAAFAQESAFPIDDTNPVRSVPSKEARLDAPLDFGHWLMEVSDRAERAKEAGDFEKAARYFEAIVASVPNRSIGYGKLCESYVGLGDNVRALAACRAALGAEGVREADAGRYLALLLRSGAQPTASEADDADAVFAHFRSEGALSAKLAEFECELGLVTKSRERLDRCTAALDLVAKDHPRTIVYSFSLSLLEADYLEGLRVISRAEEANFAPASVVKMRRELHSRVLRTPLAKGLIVAFAVAALVACAALILRFRRPAASPA